jgi:hypothetical protein
MLFPAVAVGVVAVGVWAGVTVFGDDQSADVEADWTVPMLGIAFIAAVPVVMWAVARTVLLANERRHASTVLAAAIVEWPQYSTTAQWQKVVEDDHRRSATKRTDVLVPVVILTVVIGGLAVWAALAADPAVGLALGAFWLAAMALIAGRTWAAERDRRSGRVRRVRIQPFPRCWVADSGFYHEDSGLVRFDQIAAVEVVEPDRVASYRGSLSSAARKTGSQSDLTPLDSRLARSGWSLLAITIDTSVARTLWRKAEHLLRSQEDPRLDWLTTSHVRVPPGHIGEARTAADRIHTRWLA